MSVLTEALEAWREAERYLASTTPWTADWIRARMVEEECRLIYQAIASREEAALEQADPAAPRPAIDKRV
jgi:hypothetical protein